MTRKQKRLSVILAGAAPPGRRLRTQILRVPPGQRIRLGGLVGKGTIVRGGATVAFSVTDTQRSVKVTYSGILPDLFREERGVITEDAFGPDGVFIADNVLAKHDERYMPKDVADRLRARASDRSG
ncbi:MAG: cytochrome c maturation protein CcmE [Pseudomonadota bacterium]|jgi:cytochrome c-type biogenesis protein CcmE